MIGQNIDISPEVMALSEDPSTIYGPLRSRTKPKPRTFAWGIT